MPQIKIERTKILAHHHTGRLRAHHHTSYGGLTFLLALAFVPLLLLGHATADISGGGSYQTYAVVPAVIPTTAPVITNPKAGQVFKAADLVQVQGTCPPKTLIKVYKNEVMAGATLCSNGSFELPIDLFVGTNTLIVRAYNANDIPGPDSLPVSVSLQLPGVNASGTPTLNPNTIPASQFYISSDIYYRGAEPGDTMTWSLVIAGGQPPYAVSINWGDGKTDLISRAKAGSFNISHVYTKPANYSGNYTIAVKASDQNGAQSFLQLVAIVSGSGRIGAAVGSNSGSTNGHISFIVQLGAELIGLLGLIVLSFWVGEKREFASMKQHHMV